MAVRLLAKCSPSSRSGGTGRRRLSSTTPLAQRLLTIAAAPQTETVELASELISPPQAEATSDWRRSPVIFLHGLFGSKKNNRTISRDLAHQLGRHFITLDLRNHGSSPHHPRHDYLAMADDVAAFIERSAIQQPTLIGHSMLATRNPTPLCPCRPRPSRSDRCDTMWRGAKTAMTLALRSPGTILDIVSIDNAPADVSLSSDFSRYIDGMEEIERAAVSRMEDADRILQKYEKSPVIRAFLLGNLYKPEGEATRKFRFALRVLGRSIGHLGDFPFKNPDEVRFEGRALFVRGTRGPYVPDDVLPLIGRFFPRFELADVDAGHWITSEKPEEFKQAVVDFLSPGDE